MPASDRVERRISLHDLRVLMSVVEAGSMGRAARRLATSQPAISRAISDLEHALGVRLLDRGREGVESTPYGRALVARGLTIFDELTQGVGAIRLLADPTAGELRTGASLAVATGFMACVLHGLLTQYPRLAFDVLATDTASAFHALARREVDLIVVHLVAPIAEDSMQADILLHDPHVVVAAAANPWLRRRRVALADLMDEPWVLPKTDAPYAAVVAEGFTAAGLGLPRTVVNSTLPLRSVLLATGRYLSMIPRVALQSPDPAQSLRALPIELPKTLRPLAIVTLKNRTLSPVAQTFTNAARQAAKALARKK